MKWFERIVMKFAPLGVVLLAVTTLTVIVRAAPTTDGQVAYWSMNAGSGTVLADDSGNNWSGTFYNSPTWTSGVRGNAVAFDGKDYINGKNITAINGKPQVTLSAWVKRNSPNSKVLLGKQSTTGHDIAIEFWNDGRLYFQVSRGSWAGGSVVLNDTAWHHVTLVFNGTLSGNENRLNAYVDGNRVALDYFGTVPALTTTNSTVFRFGRLQSSYSNGAIDDARLYNRALSAVEISDLMAGSEQAGDTDAPSAPTEIYATAVTQTSATLNWTASTDNTGVVGYKIYRDGVQIETVPVATQFTDNNLRAGTTYSFAVAAYDLAGNTSLLSTPLQLTTQSPPPPPTIILSVDASTVEAGYSTTLTWSSEYANNCIASGAWSGVRSTNGTESTPELSASSNFVLTCSGPGGERTTSAVVSVTDTTPPTTPANITSSNVTSTSIELRWDAASDFSGVQGYRVYRNNNLVADRTELSYIDTNLLPGTSYEYVVMAYDIAGNVSLASQPISVVTAAPVPAPLVTLTVAQTTIEAGSQALLSWTAQYASYCLASGGWSGTKTTNDSEVSSSLITLTLFVLTCFGPGGDASSSVSVSVVDTTPPTVPNNLSSTFVQQNVLTIQWSASSDTVGVAGYKVYRNGVYIADTATKSYTDTGLAADTEYSYAVLAYDTSNNYSLQSADLAVRTPAPASSLTISPDKRRILDPQGKPIFLNGDVAWSLFVQLTREEAVQYLNDRQAKGVNFLLINLLEYAFTSNPPNNRYGQNPFLAPYDYAQPNPAYFDHVQYVIQEATNRGFYLAIVPSYVGYGGAGTNEGFYDEMVSNGSTKMASFGTYVGNRFKDFNNIIWTHGGDWNPPNKQLIESMAQAMKAAAPNQLHSAHTAPDNNASSYWGTSSWLDIDNVYHYSDTYNPAKSIYQTNQRPFFHLESAYENDPRLTGMPMFRAQAYGPLLAGANGHLSGNCPIWHFSSVSYQFCNSAAANSTWQQWLDSPGSKSIEYMGKLFRSRDWANLVPDFNNQTLIAGGSTGGFATTVAARTQNGNTIIVYLHNNRTVTIDMTKVSGSNAKAWWYNPATGAATLIGTYPTTGTRQFTPSGNQDWVLVLDDAGLNIPQPGQEVPDTENPSVTLTSPTNGATLSGPVTLSATATDNRAVASVVFAIDNQQVGATLTQSPYTLNFDTTTIANGVYQLRVTASDTSGNTAIQSIAITIDNLTDTEAPVGSIAVPSGGTTVSGTVLVEVTATDNVSVTGVRLKVNGQPVGLEDTAAPYTLVWDTNQVMNGQYELSATVRDGAGNTTLVAPISVTVLNLTPPDLLVALGFNDSNSPLQDSSTKANNGNCGSNCPVFVSDGGRLGSGAYNFAGSNNWIELPNESQFDFTNNFTVSFWMKTGGFVSAWEPFLAKGDSSWTVERNNTGNTVQFTTFSPGPVSLVGSTPLDDNQWHHIAVTYDGVVKKLYIDGVLNATSNYSASIQTNNYALRLGFNQEYPAADYGGWLDDVRIYSRSLTLAEVQRDMNLPVN